MLIVLLTKELLINTLLKRRMKFQYLFEQILKIDGQEVIKITWPIGCPGLRDTGHMKTKNCSSAGLSMSSCFQRRSGKDTPEKRPGLRNRSDCIMNVKPGSSSSWAGTLYRSFKRNKSFR